MTTSTPIIVLVHGGWHTPASYGKFSTALKALGHELHIPSLPSMNGTRPPNANLETDTTLIYSYVESLVNAGHHIVILMHSYGGQVGTNALVGLGAETRRQQGLPGGVTRLIYIAAFALEEGGSMVGVVNSFGHEVLIPLAFDVADDDSCVDREPRNLVLGEPVLPDEELDAYVAGLRRWNGRAMYQEIRGCAWREIPVSYVFATADMTASFDYQKSFVERMREQGMEVETFSLETGHFPTFTKADELAGIVCGIIGK
ncbi:hypothetical protein BBP40_009530 [Aspergillus hancockii]|nr:hypothetical protein BBP40_009530 [Aspergillus hancockii]